MQNKPGILQNKKVIITVVVVLLVFFIIIMAGYITKNKDKNKGNENPEPTNIVVTDKIKSQWKVYIDELSTGNYCELASTVSFTNDCIYRNNKTARANLTVTYRLSSLILAMGSRDENNIMVGNITIDGKSMYNPHYVNLVDVEKEYKLLYGKDETFKPDTVNSINSYTIKYDSKKEKFFYLEPEPTAFVKTYIELYESTPTEVIVHVRVGYVTYEMFKYHLFTNKDKSKEISTLTTREYKEKGIITEDNFSELPEYVLKFSPEEETGNLLFISAELVA